MSACSGGEDLWQRGASIHLRTLRPEYVKEAFSRYKITYVSVVPMVLQALPPRADLRSGCPPVYDQGQLGSCTGRDAVAVRYQQVSAAAYRRVLSVGQE